MERSSRTHAYVVQPYISRGRAWEAGSPIRLSSEPQALRLAEGLSPQCLGVAVFALEVAEDVDFCGDPRLITSFGRVPEIPR